MVSRRAFASGSLGGEIRFYASCWLSIFPTTWKTPRIVYHLAAIGNEGTGKKRQGLPPTFNSRPGQVEFAGARLRLRERSSQSASLSPRRSSGGRAAVHDRPQTGVRRLARPFLPTAEIRLANASSFGKINTEFFRPRGGDFARGMLRFPVREKQLATVAKPFGISSGPRDPLRERIMRLPRSGPS